MFSGCKICIWFFQFVNCVISCVELCFTFFANLCEKKLWPGKNSKQQVLKLMPCLHMFSSCCWIWISSSQPFGWTMAYWTMVSKKAKQNTSPLPKKDTMYFTWELLSVNSKEQYAFQKVETSEEHRQQCVETCVDHSTSCFRASAKRRMGSRPSCPASAKLGGQWRKP